MRIPCSNRLTVLATEVSISAYTVFQQTLAKKEAGGQLRESDLPVTIAGDTCPYQFVRRAGSICVFGRVPRFRMSGIAQVKLRKRTNDHNSWTGTVLALLAADFRRRNSLLVPDRHGKHPRNG